MKVIVSVRMKVKVQAKVELSVLNKKVKVPLFR